MLNVLAILVPTCAIAVVVLHLAKSASLIHGLVWLFDSRALEVGAEAKRLAVEDEETRLDWAELERKHGHVRLFGKLWESSRLGVLRRLIQGIWASYKIVTISSVFVIVLGVVPIGLMERRLVLAVALGGLLVSFLALLHEGVKWLLWKDAVVSHWSNTVPKRFRDWEVPASAYGLLVLNVVVLFLMGAFSFAALYSAIDGAYPGLIPTDDLVARNGIPEWLFTGLSYGAGGVEMRGTLGSTLRLAQLVWGLLVGLFFGAFVLRGRG